MSVASNSPVTSTNVNTSFMSRTAATTSTVAAVTISDTTQSTDKDTGALIVEGGVGVEKNLNVGGALAVTGAAAITGNLTVTGDITVNGTTTTLNTSTIESEDNNILLNKGGNDASADGGGVDVVRTSDNGAFRFDSALTSKWKLGLASAMYEVVIAGLAQTISGIKTFSSGISLSSQKITNLLAGTSLTDAANKAQVDADGGFLQTTTAGTSLTLTSTSAQKNYFSGSANHTLLLPDTTTLTIGQHYEVYNASTGTIFVQSSSGGALWTMTPGQKLVAIVRGTGSSNDWRYVALPTFDSGNAYLDASSKKISNLTDPTANQDAATKYYVDSNSSGGGNVNLITNGDADNASATIFTGYDDGASSRPVDGTGGTCNYITSSITSTNPLKGTKSFTIARSANNAQGEGVAVLLDTLTPAYFAKVLQINIDYIVNSGTFQAGSSTQDSDLIWYLYDVTNSQLIEPSSIKMLSNSSTIADRFSATFQTSATGTSYRLIAHCATTNAVAFEIKCEVEISPSTYVYGTPITDWATCTVTCNFTNQNTLAKKRRVGDSTEYAVQTKFTGTPAAVGYATWTLPDTIDVAKLSQGSASTVDARGIVGVYDNSTSTTYIGQVAAITSTQVALLTHGAIVTLDEASPITFTTNDYIEFLFSVPIVGQSSSVQMSDQTDTRIVAALVTGNAASATSGNPIIFPDVTFDTHGAYNASTGLYTVQVSGKYEISGYLEGGTSGLPILAYKNSSEYSRAGYVGASATANVNAIVDCAAGDTISVRVGGTYDVSISNITFKRLTGPSAIAVSEDMNAQAVGNPASATSGNPIIMPTLDWDTHGAYSVSTGRYTCQNSGKFRISLNGSVSGGSTVTIYAYKNGSSAYEAGFYYAATDVGVSASALVRCLAGDIIDLRPNGTIDITYGVINFERIGNY